MGDFNLKARILKQKEAIAIVLYHIYVVDMYKSVKVAGKEEVCYVPEEQKFKIKDN